MFVFVRGGGRFFGGPGLFIFEPINTNAVVSLEFNFRRGGLLSKSRTTCVIATVRIGFGRCGSAFPLIEEVGSG